MDVIKLGRGADGHLHSLLCFLGPLIDFVFTYCVGLRCVASSGGYGVSDAVRTGTASDARSCSEKLQQQMLVLLAVWQVVCWWSGMLYD